MKRKLVLLALLLAFTLLLCACGCEHEWLAADCTNPATCSKCGETEGAPAGHVWKAATCTEAQTCSVCAVTEGEPAGHQMEEASCEQAKHCTQCSLTEGEALGHVWMDATTEAPKTCSVCAATEGERIITDERFTTASAQSLFGKWGFEEVVDGEAMGMPEFEGRISVVYILEFANNGEYEMSFQIGDEDAFIDFFVEVSIMATYAEFEAEGLSKEEADAAIEEAYGMSMEEYLRYTFSQVDINELFTSIFGAIDLGGVYYVDADQIYIGQDWDQEMDPSSFRVSAEELVIDALSEELGMDMVFHPIEE